jgi:hypothetical protein
MSEDDAKAMVELVLDAARGGLAVAMEAYAKERTRRRAAEEALRELVDAQYATTVVLMDRDQEEWNSWKAAMKNARRVLGLGEE